MHLVDCFVDVFSYVRNLSVNNNDLSEEQVRIKIDELFASKVHEALDSGYSQTHLDHAKFAVCAWIDEKILSSDVAFKEQWRIRLLQKHYFNTVKGGQQFFERLNTLDQFDAFDMDVREVFFYCLAFGFHGKYYTDAGLSELASIRQTNLQLLNQKTGGGKTKDQWFSQLAIEGGETVTPTKPAGWAIMFGLPLIVAVTAIAWMRLDIMQSIENLVKSL